MMTTPRSIKPVSLLLISNSYPPVIGGSEVEAQRIASAMIRRGHRVQVLCAGGPPMPPVRHWIDPAGVPVRILTRRSRGLVKDFAFALEVAWAIWSGRKRYDVVYFLMQGLHLAAGLPISHWLGKPIVMKFGGSGVIPLMRGSRVGRVELGWLRRWAARLMVLNEAMIEEGIADGFRRQQFTWMPNPVDVSEFRPAQPGEAAAWRTQHGIPLQACVTIYVGRLSSEKGLPGLLRGFAQAARRSPDAMLVLVGDGAQRAELEALAGGLCLGPDRIRFIGRVDITEVPFWLRSSDIFALTSPSEGFSCALLEAMAAGLASLVSDIPANRQLIDPGIHGLTVPFSDEAAIGEALLQLSSDPDVRKRMGEAARSRVVENYSTSRVVERYETLLSEVMASKCSR
ncbi:MAG TPA: glycosyltransferase family 4 protein [Terracidiphilus sp.]|nr:glycosyltransferase family 4 protein [Terracidiphilus sp.]